MRKLTVFALISSLLALAACAAPASPTPTPTPRDAAVAFTSHADGATVYGQRTVQLVAALTDALESATIDVTADGEVVEQSRVGNELRVQVKLRDHANTVSVSVKNPEQSAPAVATLNLDYPFLTLVNGQDAALAIGQPDLVSDAEADRTKLIGSPYLRPLIVDGVLYLPAYGTDRVLGYLQVPTESGAAADFVLGKQDFDDVDSTPSATSFNGPQTLATDGQRLFVAEYENNRISVFNTLPTSSGAAADYVIGQPDFASTGDAVSATGLYSPESLTVAAGKLIVADTDNNRVLIWNTVPTTFGVPADIVLGQPDMDSRDYNNDGGGDPTARSLDSPSDVWSDGERLVVVDLGNERVLIWNSFPTEDHAPADLVLGQPDMTSNYYGHGIDGFDTPYSVDSNGNQLFVADASNNRVLVWNSFPSYSGQFPDVVLGQPNFRNSDDGLGADRLYYPSGVYLHGNDLYVADNDNDRYVVFRGAQP